MTISMRCVSTLATLAIAGLGLLWPGESHARDCEVRGTSDLGLIVERASGSVQIVDTTNRAALFSIDNLGDLSHATAVMSRDGRYAFVFGRDGGLSKLDLLCGRMVNRVVQAGNSIGGAISQDGKLVAVANYEPGGIKVFDSSNLSQVADLPATNGKNKNSKVVGLVDAPNRRFVYSLYDAGEIRIADFSDQAKPSIKAFQNVGNQPYDALITPDGRHYIAGLFGEDGLALLDLWHPEAGVRRILDHYGKQDLKLPVYKMPHLEGWATAGDYAFLPAVGHHKLLVVKRGDWQEVAQIPVHSQPVFAIARPDGRYIWVNFAHPDNDVVQIIDAQTFKVAHSITAGKGVMHMEFTPRGEEVWISVRDEDQVKIYDTATYRQISGLSAKKPSGIFFTARAHKIGL